MAEGKANDGTKHQFNILQIIADRNQQEDLKGKQIEEYESKILNFFEYVKDHKDGKRLIAKIKSSDAYEDIYDEFHKIYRQYKVKYRDQVGNQFFQEMENFVNKLCDDFETYIKSW
ncbi:MAG: hypothetical protein ACRDB1_00310 [Microcoleaceae cyanobacterium]